MKLPTWSSIQKHGQFNQNAKTEEEVKIDLGEGEEEEASALAMERSQFAGERKGGL